MRSKVVVWENRCPELKLNLWKITFLADAQDWVLLAWETCYSCERVLKILHFWWFIQTILSENFFFSLVQKKKPKKHSRWFLLKKKNNTTPKNICSEISLRICVACALSSWLQTCHALVSMSEVYGMARHKGLTTHSVCAREELKLQGRNRVSKC